MNPDTLLSMLIQTRAQLPEALDTPFLLQRIPHTPLSLLHPVFPEGGFFVDEETHTALKTLVQWGYLMQPGQQRSEAYVVTDAGLSYSTDRGGSVWDGRERRQQRESRREYPTYMDRRS